MEQPAATSDRATWISLIAGVLLWFLHLNVIYPLTSVACKWGWFPFSVGPVSGLQVIQAVISVVMTLLLALTVVVPWRIWRRSHAPDTDEVLSQTERDRRPLMAFVTMLTNAFFLVFAVATFVPLLALNPCG